MFLIGECLQLSLVGTPLALQDSSGITMSPCFSTLILLNVHLCDTGIKKTTMQFGLISQPQLGALASQKGLEVSLLQIGSRFVRS